MQIAECIMLDLWIIVYGGDPSHSYCFTDSDKAKSSVNGAIRTYLDNPNLDEMCAKIEMAIDNKWGRAYLPLQTTICDDDGNCHLSAIEIFHVKLDSSSPICSILSTCAAELPAGDLRDRVMRLFNH